jgi:protein-S-isoprenylcysteine O-methyltransferase Ste14
MIPPALAYALGSILALASAGLALWARQQMVAVGTNILPNQPTLALAMTGPYRFTRNPMYLSLCLLETSVGFFCNAWISLVCTIPLALILHFGVVRREEAYLENKFGAPYRSFQQRVRRWF